MRSGTSPLDARRQQVWLTEKGRARVPGAGSPISGRGGGVPRRGRRRRRRRPCRGCGKRLSRVGSSSSAAHSPATSAGSSSATASSTPANTAGTSASSGWSASIAADFDPETDRAWIAERDGIRLGAVLCVHHDETDGQAPHAARRARGARPGTRHAPGATGHPPTPSKRLHDPHALDQRHPDRRPAHLRARGLHAPTRGAQPRFRRTTSSNRPGPLPSAHGPRRAEGAPGAAESRIQGRPGARP